MIHASLNLRSWFFITILIIGLTAGVMPVAADSVSYIQVSSAPSNALACLDQYSCQRTPVTFSTTADSFNSISIYQDGYLTATQTVYASDSGTTMSISMALNPNPPLAGSLDLDSRPTNADVWLDGRYYGTTPQIIGGLAGGDHTLTLKQVGYLDYTEPFTIVAGQTTTLSEAMTPYSKAPIYGDLRVQSSPLGAAVYLNNNYQGTTIGSTPLSITELTPGSYSVRVTLANYQDFSETVTVMAGGLYTIQANLVQVTPGPTPNINGQLTVRSGPSGANIYIDRAYRGITPLTLVDIPQGVHAITLRLNGYQDWTSSISVPAGTSTDVSGTLLPNPAATPTIYGTQGAPLQTQSPVSMFSIISAIAICGAAFIVYRKRE